MFPIRDHNPSGRTPFVTYALIVANVVIFALYNLRLGESAALNEFLYTWGMIPLRISYFDGLHTLFTSQFLHAGVMHIAGNMLFLWIFGDNMEDEMGHVGFLIFYLACGALAALAQWMTEPGSTIPLVGASGAIAGVMGGYLLLFPKAKVDILLIIIIFFRIFPIPAWIMLGLWFGFQLLNGVISDAEMAGVAYWAHAGGFIVGMVLATPLFLRLGGAGFWDRTDGHPPHPEAEYELTRTRIPRVRRK